MEDGEGAYSQSRSQIEMFWTTVARDIWKWIKAFLHKSTPSYMLCAALNMMMLRGVHESSQLLSSSRGTARSGYRSTAYVSQKGSRPLVD